MITIVITIMVTQVTYFEISRDESGNASQREFLCEHTIKNNVYMGRNLTFEMEENIAEIVNEILSLLQRCNS